jgi:hypothetical protein
LWNILDARFPGQLTFTYEWYKVGKVEPDLWSRVALLEYNGVINADLFIGLLPGKKGTHTEFGIALATVPHVALLGTKQDFEPIDDDNYPSIFYYLMNVKRYEHDGSMQDLLEKGVQAVVEAIQS